jgi:3-hydroxy-9,10-secoandrosta-1,3,5(10)-triene-9,17-dione monooxygenase reductase component
MYQRHVLGDGQLGGSPLLAGSMAWIDCDIVDEVDGGDHVIVLGRVLDLAADGDLRPLLFFRGRFGALTNGE